MKRYLVVLIPLCVVALITYGLDRGIYVGSFDALYSAPCCPDTAYFQKRCRYLFVTGISEIDAHDGRTSVYNVTSDLKEAGFSSKEIVEDFIKNGIPPRINERLSSLDNGYCRLFGE